MTNPASKSPNRHVRVSDLRGLAQLATQAATGVTRITEGVHQSVRNTLGIEGGPEPGQTNGITGLVYRSIYGSTRFLGQGVDTVLACMEPLLESDEAPRPGSAQREAILAKLNGVMGDRLVARANPLAIPMTLRYRGKELDCGNMLPMPEAKGKLLLMIHGLCMNDEQWQTRNEEAALDHGEVLASALGYTPVYLRFNSGLHTSQNGRALAGHLERLVAAWPLPIEELTVVAHSLGGLLIRSAVHYARQEDLRWPGHLKNIVFLGTPHHGAPLERAGNWVDVILAGTPYTAPFARVGQLRSAGITDLRYGNVLDEDWEGQDRFHRKTDQRSIMALPEGVSCFAVAATTAARRSTLADRLIGDGLVPLRSALGRHKDAVRNLDFTEESKWVGYRMNHMELLSSPEVTQQMARWLAPSAGAQ